MKLDTLTNHPPQVAVAADNPPLVAPIYQSVKFSFDELTEAERLGAGQRDGFMYSRIDNPTLRQLEQTLAALQGRSHCVLAPSGVAAVSLTLQALCKQGDHILMFAEGYVPTRAMVRRVLARFGVTHTVLSIDDLIGIERTLQTTPTRLMVFESPSNPILKIADLQRLCTLAKAHGCRTVLDNTLAGLHAHGGYPVDVYVHSLTKYANGHGDVLAGAAITDEAMMKQLRPEFMAMGATLDPQAAFLIQRGLKTYGLRYERSCQNALAIAQFLEQHPAVINVRYPGLASHPQHLLAMQQTGNGGGVISFEVKSDEAGAKACVQKLQLFRLAASLGSTESLVLPPAMLQARDLSAEQRQWVGITDRTIRLSAGIEDVADLIADLQQALAE
ncbi:MAG: aminotransferase class I/II-fold pyridoxal phosphate-dependent enzyme [Steroidobacteraceae bacterium]